MRTKNLSNEERRCIAEFLLQNSADGRVVNSGLVQASKKWEISKKSVQRIWAIAKQQKTAGLSLNVESKKKGKQGPNKMKLDEGKVKAIPFKSRCTIRRLAQKLGVGKSTMGRWLVSGAIKSHTNAIKPQLNEANKLHRLRFSILNLVHDKLLNLTKFKDMHYTLHMDEKWFNLSKASEKYYMLPSERHPYRSCNSKNYIPKIMFMGVVGRPMYGSNREVIFDGKIGMKIKGGNDYALPHMNKDALERQGVLPTDLNADNDMVRECIDYLVQQQQTNGMEELMTEMGYIA